MGPEGEGTTVDAGGDAATTAVELAPWPGDATPADPAGDAEHPEMAMRSVTTPATHDLTGRF